jgi:hypothetical protein
MKLFAFALALVSVVPHVLGEETKQPRFGIYMPKLDVYTATSDVTERVTSYLRTMKPGEIPLAEFPIVSEEDLLSYDWDTHTFELSQRLWFRIRRPGSHGLPFIVVVDGLPIYVGAFWSSSSSIPSSVPIIMWDGEQKSKELVIQRAYPTAEFGKGDDPRSNEKLRQVLQDLGKLKVTKEKH